MDRRALLKTSAALLGYGLVARTPLALASGAAATAAVRTRHVMALPPVRAAWDRVVRTTVGLRPHRDSGFVLRAESLGDATLVHNYGHGGAGMSLGWGCGALAADLALATEHRRAAVIGCGSTGLTTARQLQRRGFKVTIYAASVPPDTTSNMSLATFSPSSGLVAADRRTPEWDAQFRTATELSYQELVRLTRRGYGVGWLDNFVATDAGETPALSPDESSLLPANFYSEPLRLEPGDHPFPTKYALRTRSLRIEPSIYLAALVRDFTAAGGEIVIRTFAAAAELTTLPERVIVNCTGLGSKTMFGDEELIPIKGQLTVLQPQPEVSYRASARMANVDVAPGISLAMMPRSDGIVLGNSQERGDWSLEPNEGVRQQVVTGAIEFFSAMRG
jgi:glycine/D-amino acid oxidase-like deaminating enzyme